MIRNGDKNMRMKKKAVLVVLVAMLASCELVKESFAASGASFLKIGVGGACGRDGLGIRVCDGRCDGAPLESRRVVRTQKEGVVRDARDAAQRHELRFRWVWATDIQRVYLP